ncbi:Response_reg domain-containing protein/HisKA domain-containing protein/GAF domain-containing protein [Cephalotus follicularis]|uniref:Ethylene receptor n=1 Tax=Cephalotus follicularis TaxID=3775 RepID=A0A1Q3BFW5_CEPFO|nr:Response_reg domain-containing protein/HisKA domain-containing protein/GAF domain-containing protein [Cephalotus follicularis]
MLRPLAYGLLISYLVITVYAVDNECDCDEEGFWSWQSILECQRMSDFLIAVAYFSIPIELLYFVSCSNFPFKWVLLQFIAFIVLCGLTHLLNAWTYYTPHTFQLILSLTIAKFFTALVSCATAISLFTLIPLLLKWKVREFLLNQNVLELDQEVGMMKKHKEASLHVRMLTREIRKSLDKHTILYTTLVELSKTLDLHNCAVWMPNENRTEMNLTHELRRSSSKEYHIPIPVSDPDVSEIKASKGVRILRPDSALATASGGGSEAAGAVAAIRMPMLRVSNFKGGTPELVETCYAILVLVLPNAISKAWSFAEMEIMEIVEVVADQVAVALSHAAVLEESQLMREKLGEQNRVLQQAKKNAMMASQAKNSFQKVMSYGMRRPMHSILGLLSMFQDENMSLEQKIIADTLVKTSNVLSTLINDVMEISEKDNGRLQLEMRPFQLHSMIKEACCLAKCLCAYIGFGFETDVQSSLPDQVMGDERRTFQVILHMVGYLLDIYDGGGAVIFRVFSKNGSEDKSDRMLEMWRSSMPDEYVCVKFEIEIRERNSQSDSSSSTTNYSGRRHNRNEINEGLSFSMCKKLVKMMQGDIWIIPSSIGFVQSILLVLMFQTRPCFGISMFSPGNSSDQPISYSQFRGLRVILADDDDVNRTVTKKLLEKLGCKVTAVSTGFECLTVLTAAENPFQIVVLDLHMHEMDGFEVAMRVRKFRGRNRPVIIALTASAEDNVWERCLQTGMNGVIRKPVPLQGMAAELQKILQRADEGL